MLRLWTFLSRRKLKMKNKIFQASLISLALFGGTLIHAADENSPERITDKRGDVSGPVAQGIYSKPVWRKTGRGTYVGGYADFEYRNRQNGKQKFEVLRLVPFIYADIAPGIRFATEIEFEHGGVGDEGTVEVDPATGKGTAELSGESKVEFAILDYDLISEALGFRLGLILSPLGKFNSIHDSPINDLNDRPMISRTIIPSTFFEPGAGFFGTSYPMDPLKLDYQLYITQGFNGGATGNGKISSSNGIRGARSNVNGSGDNNEKLALTGRLGISPFLGTDLGASFHTGAWDNAGQNELTVLALDWGFQWKSFEFLGEYGNAQIQRDLNTHSSVPGRMDGYYLQTNYHFLHDFIRKDSVFTAVTRWDHQDLDLLNQTSLPTANSSQRVTLGLNFRPLEQTVFKLDYQINYEHFAPTRTDNNAWVAGFATYF